MATCKMFGGLFKPKFYNKCKAAIKLTKMRLETIKRKRDAVLKFMKNDIADLLRNDLDYNAYGRVEGLFIEKNITRCYKLIEEFCECVLDNLSNMLKQSECSEECREAVASLAFGAARFADLPELRDLRSLFYNKYGKSIDIFINKEFASRVRAEHPEKETKLQLMRDVALELCIEWDSKSLEQKLSTPSCQKSVESTTDDMETDVRWNMEEKQIQDTPLRKETQNGFSHDLSINETIDVQDEITVPPTETAALQEEEVEKKKPPNSYENISPPPYRREAKNLESSSKPKPRSVRQRRPRLLPLSGGEEKVEEEETNLVVVCEQQPKKAVLHEQEKTNTKMEEDEIMEYRLHASSLAQSEMLGSGRHVHPKLPQYDELAARIAQIRRTGET